MSVQGQEQEQLGSLMYSNILLTCSTIAKISILIKAERRNCIIQFIHGRWAPKQVYVTVPAKQNTALLPTSQKWKCTAVL